MRRLILRLVSCVRSRRADAEVSRDVDLHLTLLEDTYRATGLRAEAARLAARDRSVRRRLGTRPIDTLRAEQ
jgi:hypothetical protein